MQTCSQRTKDGRWNCFEVPKPRFYGCLYLTRGSPWIVEYECRSSVNNGSCLVCRDITSKTHIKIINMGRLLYLGGALFAVLFAWVYQGVNHRFNVLGLTRSKAALVNIHGHDLRIIPNTIQCEDLHIHEPSGLLFTACQGESESRLSYFPPLVNFLDPMKAAQIQGSIYVVNPKVWYLVFIIWAQY